MNRAKKTYIPEEIIPWVTQKKKNSTVRWRIYLMHLSIIQRLLLTTILTIAFLEGKCSSFITQSEADEFGAQLIYIELNYLLFSFIFFFFFYMHLPFCILYICNFWLSFLEWIISLKKDSKGIVSSHQYSNVIAGCLYLSMPTYQGI